MSRTGVVIVLPLPLFLIAAHTVYFVVAAPVGVPWRIVAAAGYALLALVCAGSFGKGAALERSALGGYRARGGAGNTV